MTMAEFATLCLLKLGFMGSGMGLGAKRPRKHEQDGTDSAGLQSFTFVQLCFSFWAHRCSPLGNFKQKDHKMQCGSSPAAVRWAWAELGNP